MSNFSGKNILIIGASSGIGEALANILTAQGANVYAASRHEPTAKVAHYQAYDALSGTLQDLPEVLHGLVYCPGSITLKPFHRLTEEDFLNDYRINVLGAAKAVQAALKSLKQANGASVVLFSTVAVAVGMTFHASISAAKGAVEGLAKSLAAELAPVQIRVNVIAPSLTDTPLAKNLLSSDEKKEAAGKRHPLGRTGTAQDIAELAQYLLTASWMSGQVIGIDGGMSNLR